MKTHIEIETAKIETYKKIMGFIEFVILYRFDDLEEFSEETRILGKAKMKSVFNTDSKPNYPSMEAFVEMMAVLDLDCYFLTKDRWEQNLVDSVKRAMDEDPEFNASFLELKEQAFFYPSEVERYARLSGFERNHITLLSDASAAKTLDEIPAESSLLAFLFFIHRNGLKLSVSRRDNFESMMYGIYTQKPKTKTDENK